MRINPQDKMCGNGKMEKHILVNVLKRICLQAWPGGRKSSFRWRRLQLDRYPERSGGAAGSDQQLETARFRFPYNTPTSKKRICTGRSLKNSSRFRAPLMRAGRPVRRVFFR